MADQGQTHSLPRRPRSRSLDPKHRRSVAHAPAILSELQNRPSPVPTLVSSRSPARHPYGRGQYPPRTRGHRRVGMLHRRHVRIGERRWRRDWSDQTRKGVKIMGIVDRHRLPLLVSTHAANHHEVTLVQLSFDFYMIEAKPENPIGGRAYDSDPLDEELRKEGTEMIAPHRKNRKRRKTQDGRRLCRYERRWMVERFFVWVQWQRRMLARWEYHAENFLGFVQLASLGILLRRF